MNIETLAANVEAASMVLIAATNTAAFGSPELTAARVAYNQAVLAYLLAKEAQVASKAA